MHELSIALGIIEIASEEAERRSPMRVCAVHLKLGPLSGVDKDALFFSFEVASRDTPVEGARLQVEEIPVVIFCRNCNEEREIDSIQHLACSLCSELSVEVRRGRELEVVALELEEVELTEALV